MGVVTFGNPKGYRMDVPRYNRRLVDRYILKEDRDEILVDISAEIYRDLAKVLDKPAFEHRFVYSLLANNNLLIGIDARDLVKTEVDQHDPLPPEEPLEDH